MAAGIALGQLIKQGQQTRFRPLLAYAVILTQLLLLRYDVTAHLPRWAEVPAGEAAIARIRDLPEPVLIPYHPYYLHLADHKTHMHFHMVNELISSLDPYKDNRSDDPWKQKLRRQICEPLRKETLEAKWGAMISSQISFNDGPLEVLWGRQPNFGSSPQDHYRLDKAPSPPLYLKVFDPMTGNKIQPLNIYLAR